MYKNNIVFVKMDNKFSNSFKTTKELFITSPMFFKIFLEQAFKPWKTKCEGIGILVRDDYTYALSFAADQVTRHKMRKT